MYKTYINEKIIGKRLRKSRKDKRLSAYEVAKKLNYEQYQTITKFEKEQAIPSAGVLLKLCNLYDCEVGYLTGDFDCKKREVADIQKEIGLSEKAIENLRALNVASSEYMHIISSLIEDETFIPFMNVINLYINENTVSKNVISHLIDSITNIKNYCDVGDVVASEFCEEFYANCANNLFWKIIDKYKREKAVKSDAK